LQKILTRIPGAYFSGENHDALAGLMRSYLSARLTRQEAGREKRSKAGDPWRGAHLTEPDRYNHRLINLFIEEIIQPPRSARIIGFKEVRYFDHEHDLPDYLEYISHSFPGALLLFNRRDPQEVAVSGWWKSHPADIAAEVEKFDRRIDDYLADHPNDGMIINYNDMCRDPEHLRPLFERLGAPFNLAEVKQIMAQRLTH